MASLFNTKISNTYVGLIKTIDNAVLSSSLRELTDGSGNASGISINNSGDLKATGTISFGSLLDIGESITISKFVDEADGIANNDNDTSIPTSAAIKDYVDSQVQTIDTLGEILGNGNTTDGTDIRVTGGADITFVDGAKAKFGDGNDLEIYHSSGSSIIDNTIGDLIIKVSQDDGDIIFQSDNGSGGISTYFRVDGGTVRTIFEKEARFLDNIPLKIGTSGDLSLSHDSTNTRIENFTGALKIINNTDDGDIEFFSDDGSGGIAEYFKLDGSLSDGTYKYTKWNDYSVVSLGTGNDLQLFHDSTKSRIENLTGNLEITQKANDADIIFASDDGSGGTTTYFKLDGSSTNIQYFKNTLLADNVKALYGDGADLQIYHDGSDSYIKDTGTGDLIIEGADQVKINAANGENAIQVIQDGTVLLRHNNLEKLSTTSTGVTVTGTIISDGLTIGSDEQINLGSNDLRLLHNGSAGYIQNFTGDLQIQNNADDSDILFRSDDGSGGLTTYFYVDGSATLTRFEKGARFTDSALLELGTSGDLQIFHNSTDSFIDNHTGNLTIRNRTDDGDIVFVCDDGSGGLATYLTIDGGNTRVQFNKDARFVDNAKVMLGTSDDLQIYHNGSNSFISDTGTGLLVISSNHLQVYNSGISEFMITAVEDGAVNLYYDGSKKFETTSTGVSVTGGITTTDDITIEGGTARKLYINSSTHNAGVQSTATLDFGYGHSGSPDSIARIQLKEQANNSFDGDLIFSVPSNNGSGGSEIVQALTIKNTTEAQFAGSVVIAQDLTVNGTTTTVNTETLAVEDPLISMAKDNSANSVDIGFYGRYNDGTQRYTGLFMDASSGTEVYRLFKGVTSEPTTTVNISATGYSAASLVVDGLTAGNVIASGYIQTQSKVIFDYGGSHYLQSGTNSLAYKTSGGTSVVSFNASSLASTFAGDVNVQDNLFLQDGSTVRAKIQLNSSDRDNLDIKAVSLGSLMRFYTVDTLALTLDDSQNATFAGTITSGAITSSASVIASGNSNSFGNTTVAALTANSISSSGSLSITGNSNSIGITTFTGNVTISDGNSPQLRVTDTTNTVTAKLMSDNTTGFVGTHTNHDLSFIINNNVKGTLDTSGNLGLNTNSPNHKVDIYAEANVGLRIHRPNSDLSSDEPIGIGFSTRSDGTTSTTDTRSGLFSYYNGNLFLSAANSDITSDPYANRKVVITSAGNVVLSANLMPNAENAHNIGSSSMRWEDLYVDDGYLRDAYIDEYIYHNGDTDTYIRFTDNTMTFRTAGDDAMVIDSNRRIGIGVDAPDAKLQVRQTAATTSSILSNGDYGIIIEGNDSGTAGESVGLHLSGKTVGTNPIRGVSLLAELQSTGNDHDLLFATSDSGAAPLERMRLTGTGNLILRNVSTLEAPTTDFLKEMFICNVNGVGTFASNGASNGAYGSFNFQTRKGDSSDPLNCITMDNSAVTLHRNVNADARVKVSGSNTDQYFFEGERNGVGVTYRLYDNSNNVYHDSYTSQVFRVNQIGGSGGKFIVQGGESEFIRSTANSTILDLQNTLINVGGASVDSYSAIRFTNTTSGGSHCEIRQYANAWANSLSDLAFFTGDTSGSSTERMRLKADGRLDVDNSIVQENMGIVGHSPNSGTINNGSSFSYNANTAGGNQAAGFIVISAVPNGATEGGAVEIWTHIHTQGANVYSKLSGREENNITISESSGSFTISNSSGSTVYYNIRVLNITDFASTIGGY